MSDNFVIILIRAQFKHPHHNQCILRMYNQPARHGPIDPSSEENFRLHQLPKDNMIKAILCTRFANGISFSDVQWITMWTCLKQFAIVRGVTSSHDIAIVFIPYSNDGTVI